MWPLQENEAIFGVTLDRTRLSIGATMISDLSLRARHSVAGRTWALSTNSAELLETVRQALPDSVDDPKGERALRLDIAVMSTDDGPWERPIYRGRDHLVLTCLSESSALVYDYSRCRVVGQVSRAVAADVQYWRNIVLPFTLGVMSPLLATVPLHAACVIHDGCGVLIGARSGAGKSTLAATLVRRGVTFVSDDWVYLTAAPQLRVHSMPVPLKLLPDSVRFFPELASLRPQTAENGEVSIPVDPAATFGARREFRCEPRVVILFDRAPGPLRVRQASIRDLTDWFSESLDCVPPCLKAEREQQLELICRLQNCRCYVVVTDGSPEQIADDILRVAEGRASIAPAIEGADSSGIMHLDLLRRGHPAPHKGCVAVGDETAHLATNHPDLPGQFEAVRPDDRSWSITVIAEPALGPERLPYSWERGPLAFFSLGANGLIVCDHVLREAAAFVLPSAIEDGAFAADLARVVASRSLAAVGGACS